MAEPTTELERVVSSLRKEAQSCTTDQQMRHVISRIAQVTRQYKVAHGIGVPDTPVGQAMELDPSAFIERDHLTYLSDRLSQAVRDVEHGVSRQLVVSMPPRMGKSTLISRYTPLWVLRSHPDWKIVLTSHDGNLTAEWAKWIREQVESHTDLGIALKPDGGAASRWSTVEGGGMYATSVRGGLTGRGAKVMIVDDPVRDFVEAHSVLSRQSLWDWWLGVVNTRLEPPYLVIVVMTRWHEDDMIGRLLSNDFEGDPSSCEEIRLPALAEENDPLGRSEGMPLISPLLHESTEQALARWDSVRSSVGTYVFSAMHQQRPAPAKGAIFDPGWWRFWTRDPAKETEDGRVVYLDPSTLTGGQWADSWDCAFKSTHPDTGGWVVGQRWVRNGANRYLIHQQRGRWSFTQTISAMRTYALTNDPGKSPCGHLVHQRVIEEAANGAAVIDTLRDEIAGLKPVTASIGKVARAQMVTPEIESGNVFLPHPSDPGNEWVNDYLNELRNFPNDTSDDQVDATTQALVFLRQPGKGRISVPGRYANRNTMRPGWQRSTDQARARMRELSRRT